MSDVSKLPELLSSYFEDNNTNPRKLAKEIDSVVGIPNSINYNTLYYWSKGKTQSPYSASLVLPLLYERASGTLKELASNLMDVLEINSSAKLIASRDSNIHEMN